MGFSLASRILSHGYDAFRMASYGALAGIPALVAVILAGPLDYPGLFALGTLMIGFAAGIFGHGTLTATMNLAPETQRGLALGAWGAVQASAAGMAVALGGIIRDVVTGLATQNRLVPALTRPATGYHTVYTIEIILLVATLFAMAPLIGDTTAAIRIDEV